MMAVLNFGMSQKPCSSEGSKVKLGFMQLVVTQAKSLQAFSWIKNGWRIFTLQPAPFMAISGILLAFSLLGQMVPVASFFIVFLLPFLTAGFYQCASRAEQGEKIQASDVFHYLNQISQYTVFLRLALVSILVSIPASSFAMEIAETMKKGVPPTFGMLAGFVVFIALNFMLTAFAIAAAWVSPKTPVLTLVFQSFRACWVNVLPLTLYGLLMASIFLISMPILVVGWLIAFALSFISFYQMFLDIYQPAHSSEENTTGDEEALNSEDSDQDTGQESIEDTRGQSETDGLNSVQSDQDTLQEDVIDAEREEVNDSEKEQTETDGVDQEPDDRTDHRQD